MTALRVRPAAERDVDGAADHYAREADVDLALRFFSAVQETYRRIAEHPDAGAPVTAFDPKLAGLRFKPVAGFEMHLVFYVPAPGSVEVVRVLHGARDLEWFLGEGAGGEGH